ncbi:MAG TPA: endonuclease/exonuclease/phosphatase family protein [Alphaproteobacteria bacterium]|nr:endonuclease/exonuclease/phosphatase family protein [Alphaproteobacteria bacterium]
MKNGSAKLSVAARLALLSRRTVAAIEPVPEERRRAILDLPSDPGTHARLLEALPLFDRVEVRNPPLPSAPPAVLRVAFWNAERCRYFEEAAELLAAVDADIVLMAEVDVGMARSGNRHIPADLAAALGYGYVFGVEFLELGLGSERERRHLFGGRNDAGLHGCAILSRHPFRRPMIFRLDEDGAWFDGARGERRLGGRIAVGAVVPTAFGDLAVVATHFESHAGPPDRAGQMGRLAEAVAAWAPGLPAVLGGDFNTTTLDLPSKAERRRVVEALPGAEARLADPVPYEPLFEIAASAGYDWRRCNLAGAVTQRTRRDGTPAPPLGRLDWFLTKGLAAESPAVVPATDAAGQALSDHDIVVVTLGAARSE